MKIENFKEASNLKHTYDVYKRNIKSLVEDNKLRIAVKIMGSGYSDYDDYEHDILEKLSENRIKDIRNYLIQLLGEEKDSIKKEFEKL